MNDSVIAVHDAASGTCLGFMERRDKQAPRGLAVSAELIVVGGLKSGAEVYPWNGDKV